MTTSYEFWIVLARNGNPKAMPVMFPRHTKRPLAIGDYYVNRRSGAVVEIMAVDLSGDVMVLDITAPLDGDWQRLTESQISSCLWERVASRQPETAPQAAA